jgi:hypothetical protein
MQVTGSPKRSLPPFLQRLMLQIGLFIEKGHRDILMARLVNDDNEKFDLIAVDVG